MCLNHNTAQRLERMIWLFLGMSEQSFYVSARYEKNKASAYRQNKIAHNQASRICNHAICQHRAQKEDLLDINPRHFFKYVSTRLHPTSNNIVFTEAG